MGTCTYSRRGVLLLSLALVSTPRRMQPEPSAACSCGSLPPTACSCGSVRNFAQADRAVRQRYMELTSKAREAVKDAYRDQHVKPGSEFRVSIDAASSIAALVDERRLLVAAVRNPEPRSTAVAVKSNSRPTTNGLTRRTPTPPLAAPSSSHLTGPSSPDP